MLSHAGLRRLAFFVVLCCTGIPSASEDQRRYQKRWTCRPSSMPEIPPRRPPTMAEASTPADRPVLLRVLRGGDGPRPLVPVPLLPPPLGRWTPTSKDYCGSIPTATTMTIAMILMIRIQMNKTSAVGAAAAGTNHETAREVPLLLRRRRRPAAQASVPVTIRAASPRMNAKLQWPRAAADRYFPCPPPVGRRRPGPSRSGAAPPAAAAVAARPPYRPTRP